MNYKFGIVLEEANDYLRRFDINFFKIKEEDYKLQFDNKGRAYVLEDVNMNRTEKLMKFFQDRNIKVRIESAIKWKELPKLD